MTQLADIWYGSHNANYGRSHHYNDSLYHTVSYTHLDVYKRQAFTVERPSARMEIRTAGTAPMNVM